MRALPILSPCNESFDAMAPAGTARRHCEECDKDVHDLSATSEAEAKALLAANKGKKLCVRYARDAGGNVRFRVGLAAAAALAVTAVACSSAEPSAPLPAQPVVTVHSPDAGADVNERLEVLMGDVEMDEDSR